MLQAANGWTHQLVAWLQCMGDYGEQDLRGLHPLHHPVADISSGGHAATPMIQDLSGGMSHHASRLQTDKRTWDHKEPRRTDSSDNTAKELGLKKEHKKWTAATQQAHKGQQEATKRTV